MEAYDHLQWMERAIIQAQEAAEAGEVPVGAVLVDAFGNLLREDRNRTIQLIDPTGHAEILTLRRASREIGNYRLLNTTLYVTVEPCVMCMGAIVHARVARLVFGAPDPKWGAAGSLYDLSADERLNHRVDVIPGICEDRCRDLMKAFFQERRKRRSDNSFHPDQNARPRE
ncbi:MAG: tRNA adenosine(34) deaminase TadA [Thermodesulfobacteriota bacterium]